MKKTRIWSLTAMLMAMTFVITRFIQIPIPLGYFNIGNSVILIGCTILPLPYGVVVGGIGSALADLTSFPVYTIPTLIIKTFMPLAFYGLQKLPVKHEYGKVILAFAIATLIPLFGYTITGGILYGGFVAGLAQFPGLLIEYAANIALFALAYKQLRGVLMKEKNIANE